MGLRLCLRSATLHLRALALAGLPLQTGCDIKFDASVDVGVDTDGTGGAEPGGSSSTASGASHGATSEGSGPGDDRGTAASSTDGTGDTAEDGGESGTDAGSDESVGLSESGESSGGTGNGESGGSGTGASSESGDSGDTGDTGTEGGSDTGTGECSESTECPFGANSFPVCEQSLCAIGCDAGYDSCDADPGTGCEVSVDDDINNCGACGNACAQAGGTPSCDAGSCDITCDLGRANCNAAWEGGSPDGCEVNLDADAENCGACGRSCGGGTCDAGTCQGHILTYGQANPMHIVVADDHVYWTTEGTSAAGYLDGALRRMPIAGGSVETLAAELAHPVGLSVDGGWVYFTELGPNDTVAFNYPWGRVSRVPVTGGTPTLLFAGQAAPWDVVALGDTLWWASGGTYQEVGGGSLAYNDDGQIWRGSSAGGGQTVLAVAQEEPVRLRASPWFGPSGRDVFWINRGGFSNSAGAVKQWRTDGTVRTLASGLAFPSALDVTTDHVYFAVDFGGVSRVAYSAPTPTPIVLIEAGTNNDIWDLRVEGEHIYWLNGDVERASLDGSGEETLVRAQDGLSSQGRGLDVSSTGIVWTAQYAGAIGRIAHP